MIINEVDQRSIINWFFMEDELEKKRCI